jgi:cytosine/adenosine deaminase-related metal-dependent hydrolase
VTISATADVSLLVHAGRLVAAHDLPCIADGGVAIAGDTIREIGYFNQLAARYPSARTVGGGRFLLIPGLINAHGHGRGLSTFQRGVLDNSLETWIWDTRQCPSLPVYEDTAYSACRLLKSGVTAAMHNHLSGNFADCEDEHAHALNAYADTGLRVFFCPGARNTHPLVYGDNQAFLSTLPNHLRQYWSTLLSAPVLAAETYVRSVKELQAARQTGMAKIGFGPLAPQWCSLDLLQQTMAAARSLGTRVHIHVAETILQKIYGLTESGRSLIQYMAAHQLLGPDLVIAHGVWVTEEDINRMAACGTGLTHQPSSNLRLRAGIAPVGAMIKAGVRVGIGLDGMAINDDDDMIQEMKLCFRLHQLDRLDIGAPSLTARQIFKMATETNAQLIGFGREIGRLEPGRKADMVLLDYERMCRPYTDPAADPIETLLYRGSSRHIHSVIVDGKEVVVSGQIVTLDENQLCRRLAMAASNPIGAAEEERAQMTAGLKKHLIHYYRHWTERIAAKPFYLPNSRTES